MLFAAAESSSAALFFLQNCLDGLTYGSLIALIALGYTMVYGIIGLINFAHGDVFMLGALLSGAILFRLSDLAWLPDHAPVPVLALGILLLALTAALFCAAINVTIDIVVYRPLRRAPKLAALVSAIGVSFVLVNVGLLWGGPLDVNVPEVISKESLLPAASGLRISSQDVLIVSMVLPLMLGLAALVKQTRLGKAMRAVQQNPAAAELMGIPVERVISATFAIGGALAGVAGLIDALTRGTNNFQMGYQFGLYAFTAAVLGGIGSIPGAVLGGLVIGLVRALTEGYLKPEWSNTVIFGILVLILVFRPNGILGRSVREKV
jgi:branched-chain amino acid transport system permease protein